MEPLPFYYANLDQRATKLLLTKQPEGTYLLRPSSDPRAVSTISVKAGKRICNMRLFKSLNCAYYLESPMGEHQYFDSINNLINFYTAVPKISPVDINGKSYGCSFSLKRPLLMASGRMALDCIL